MGPKTRGVPFWFLPFLFLTSFAVYLVTLSPSFQPDDSAETIAACVTLAPQHPSGYPFYSCIGRLFSFVPIGNPAFRSNLLAAGLGSLVVTLVGLVLFRMGSFRKPPRDGTSSALNLLPAFAGAMVLAFSKTYWNQCLTAKGVIYILQGLVFLGMVHWLEKREAEPGKNSQPKIYLAMGLLMGLGLANGWEMQVLFFTAFLLYLGLKGSLARLRSIVSLKKLLFFSSCALIGFSPYLLLPLRQLGSATSMVWGDPRHLRGFIGFLSNQDVRQEVGLKIWENFLHLSGPKGEWPEAWHQLVSLGPQWERISTHLSSDLGLLAWIPLIAGILFLRRKGEYPLLAMGLATCLLLIVANGFLFITPVENLWCVDKFFISTNVFGALCIGVGIRELAAKIGTYRSFKGSRRRHVFLAAVVGLGLIFPAFSLFTSYGPNSQSSQTLAYDYGADLLKSLKKDAVFVGEGDDPLFSIYFFQEVLGLRKDVVLVPAYYLWAPWGARSLEDKLPGLRLDESSFSSLPAGQRVFYGLTRIVDHLKDKRPIQVSANLDLLDRCYFELQPSVLHSGDLDSVLAPSGFSWSLGGELGERGFDLLDQPRERIPKVPVVGGPEDSLFNLRAQSYFNAAEYCSKKGLVDRADRYFAIASEKARAPKLLAHIWAGRGDSLWAQKKDEPALEAYRNSVTLNPEPAFYARLVRSLLLRGSFPEALEEAQRSTELFPEDGQTWRALAACEEALGDRQKAHLDLQRALEMEKSKRGGPP